MQYNGMTGKILKIDLSAPAAEIVETSAYAELSGGAALASRILLQELPKLGENPSDEQLIPLLPWDDNLPAYCRLKES